MVSSLNGQSGDAPAPALFHLPPLPLPRASSRPGTSSPAARARNEWTFTDALHSHASKANVARPNFTLGRPMRAHQIVPVILSGGSGTRLWPVSRESFPKQLWPLTSDRSMIQETVLRARGDAFAPPIVVCNQEHRFLIAEQ